MDISFEKKNKFFDLLKKGEDYHRFADFKSYKGIVLDKEYILVSNLDVAFSEFRDEFQINHLCNDAKKYISLLNKDLKKIINELNVYHKEQIETVGKYRGSILDQDDTLDILFWTVNYQKKIAEETTEYINNNFTEEVHIESDLIENDILPVLTKSAIKVNFNGKQIDLVLLFWCMQNAGLISFTSRKEFADFLDTHFNFKIAGEYKSLKSADIESVISKIMNTATPSRPKYFSYDKSKNAIFCLLDKTVDELKTKITFVTDELHMPPPLEQDKLPNQKR